MRKLSVALVALAVLTGSAIPAPQVVSINTGPNVEPDVSVDRREWPPRPGFCDRRDMRLHAACAPRKVWI